MQKIIEKQSSGTRIAYIVNNSNRICSRPKQADDQSFTKPNASTFRNSSNAHSKTKIRLVSPLKQGHNTAQLKENHPPLPSKLATSPNNYRNQRPAFEIQLGGRTTYNQRTFTNNNDSITSINHNTSKQVAKPAVSPALMSINQPTLPIRQPPVTPFSPKGISPSKIKINNKCFDIASIKSKVIFVAPLQHHSVIPPPTFAQNEQYRTYIPSQTYTSEFLIQKDENLPKIKDTNYESQMAQIKQLQNQIEENNLKIRQLLAPNNQEVGPSTPLINCLINPIMETKKKLINELNNTQKKTSQSHRDEVSVQTEHQEESSYQIQSRCLKFAITRNNQCQIKVVSSHVEGQPQCSSVNQSNQCRFAQNSDDNSAKWITHGHFSINHELIPKNQIQKIDFSQKEEEIIPVSQRSLHTHSQCAIAPYEVNVHLKTSRASSKQSIIEYSHTAIEFQEEPKTSPIMQADPIKSIIDIPAITSNTPSYPPKNSQPSPQIANSSIKKPQKQSEVTVNVAGSIKGSSFAGKRRINNAMYL